ncbi:MAG: RidA family protein [Sphingosinicella sp.]|nr:RidA family protein [Sphingosinicella sp.]
MRELLPPGWPRPKGYANGIAARGRMIFTAGVVGWDEQEHFVSENLVGQFRQVLINTLAILKEGGASPEHVVRMTWYVTDRQDYVRNIAEIGAIYRELMGKCYPVMAVVQVVALVDPAARVEIETTAVVPDE